MNFFEYLNIGKLADFYARNVDCPHVSKYHRESYPTHCWLVIDKMTEQYEQGNISEEALAAAYLHDIGKPRTAAVKPDGDACFYGHEQVTEEEVAIFLDPGYQGFSKVVALIRAHMLPMLISERTPEPYRSDNIQKLHDLAEKWGEEFMRDLDTLTRCDLASSITEESCLQLEIEKARARAMAVTCQPSTPW